MPAAIGNGRAGPAGGAWHIFCYVTRHGIRHLKSRPGTDIAAIAPDGEKIRVGFTDGKKVSYDAIFYFLGGSAPRSFLEKAGVCYSGNRPNVDQYGETDIPGLFPAGDLVADKGTIMAAFNSAAATVEKIRNY